METKVLDNDNVEFSVGKYVFNTNTLIAGEHRFKLTTKETQLMRLLVIT